MLFFVHNTLTAELAVCGYNAVTTLSLVHPEYINRLFLREDMLYSFTHVCKQLAARRHMYKICSNEELERICKSTHHQGVVAMIEEPKRIPLSREDLNRWAAENLTGIILNAVGNDHNLGAIIRSAAFFDSHFVIVSDTDGAAFITTSTYRIAEGGMEYVEVRTLQNIAAFLKEASTQLTVIGADLHARLRIHDMKSFIPERKKGFVLVVGNEEHGLEPDVRLNCPLLMRIPGTATPESLNVAQAATIFLYEVYNC
ncbi:putative RNA methyltransferase, TrmH family [Pillotina sp. SPG140]|jgi:TrmH RNA methyltransferase